MSRIFEALERAENERESDSPSRPSPTIATALIPGPVDEALDDNEEFFHNIARQPWTPSLSSLPTLAEGGAVVEQFRSLRSSIYQIRDQVPLKTIVVSSGMAGEGKTFVAANLATSLARNNERPVLLIDADLRRPTIHNLLGTSDTPGLTQYLIDNAKPLDVLQRAQSVTVPNEPGARALSNLVLLPAGQHGDRSPELAGNSRLEELIAVASRRFSWIIIDSPPALVVTDAIDLARVADGVLLVARGGVTSFDIAQRTKTTFASSRILGFVLNAVAHVPRAGSYYYYRGHSATDSFSSRDAQVS